METLLADLRYALRTMRRNLGFTAIALAALALGIGANTAIFTVVDAVLLQPLPYPQPDRIMKLGRQFRTGVGYSNSIPKYMAWRQNDVFDAMALYDFGALAMNVGSGNPPQTVKGLHVSGDYFKVFGVSPVAGRTFSQSEDLPNGPAVAVISYGVSQSRLGGTNEVLGRPILLNGVPYTVVGILPRGFQPDPEADVWIPLQAEPNSTNQGHYLNVAGRLKPGVTVAGAQAQMKIVGEQFRKANPKWMDAEEGVAVVPMRDATTGEVRTALLVLFGAVALVLLIACANVANLLLARAAGRQRELAIRSAVGANRGRVVRQLLTESVLLAGCGGMLGLGLGAAGVRGLLLLVPGNIPRVTDANRHGRRHPGARLACDGVHDRRLAADGAAVRPLSGAAHVETGSGVDAEGSQRPLGHRPPAHARTLGTGRRGDGVGARAPGRSGAADSQFRGVAFGRSRSRSAQCVHVPDVAGGRRVLHHGERERLHDAGGPTRGNVARRRGRGIDHRAAGRGRRRSAVHDRRQTARAGRVQRR